MFSQLRLSIARAPMPRLMLTPPVSLTPVRNSQTEPAKTVSNDNQTFASLVRNCKLTRIGNPVGKVVIGKIYHVVGEDLYIDFGHKFGCVCTKPRYDQFRYL